MKGANKYMEILLVVFLRKKFILGNLMFLALRAIFLLFDWAWSNWARPLLIGYLNNQDMISFMITTGSLNNQDMISFMIATEPLNSQYMIRILKQWRHDFSGKHLFDGHSMDISDIYVWRSKSIVL